MKRGLIGLLISIGALMAVVGYNASVAVPVAAKLSGDSRNHGVGLYAYRTWGLSPDGLTVDLIQIDAGKAPVDMFRSLFQTAQTLRGRHFTKVTLARRGKPVFVMSGADFHELGASFEVGENPIYLIRTLPEKLYKPTGEGAFGHWEGGWLGVLGKQMEDVNAFAREWVAG